MNSDQRGNNKTVFNGKRDGIKTEQQHQKLNEHCMKRKNGMGFEKKSHTIERKWKNSKYSEDNGPHGEPTVGTQHVTI